MTPARHYGFASTKPLSEEEPMHTLLQEVRALAVLCANIAVCQKQQGSILSRHTDLLECQKQQCSIMSRHTDLLEGICKRLSSSSAGGHAPYDGKVPEKSHRNNKQHRNTFQAGYQARIRFSEDPSECLCESVSDEDLHLLRYLHANGELDVNVVREDGMTPLSVAAQEGRLDAVRWLIEEANADMSVGVPPLFAAAMGGHIDVAKYLCEEAKIDVNRAEVFSGFTPISFAAGAGDLEMVRYLHEHAKADVQKSQAAPSPGDMASPGVTQNCCDTSKYDLEKSYRLWGHHDMFFKLYEQFRYAPDVRGITGVTPVYCAASCGHVEVVRYLCESAKVDVEKADRTLGKTAMHVAASNGHVTVMHFLHEGAKVDIEKPDPLEGRTPVNSAALHGALGVVRYLYKRAKVDVEKPDIRGNTPLFSAAVNGHLAVVRFLCEDANVNPILERPDGLTPRCAVGFCRHLSEKVKKEVFRYLKMREQVVMRRTKPL